MILLKLVVMFGFGVCSTTRFPLDDDELNKIGSYFSKLVVHSPCQHYHTYICGDLREHENILSDELQYMDLKYLTDTFVMNSKSDRRTMTDTERKARDFMNTCSEKYDVTKILRNLVDVNLFNFNTTWPVTAQWNATLFQWIEMSAEFMSFGKPVVIDVRKEVHNNQTVLAIHPKLFSSFAYEKVRPRLLFERVYMDKYRFLMNKEFENMPTSREIFTINELKSEMTEFRRYFRKLLPTVHGDSTVILYNREQLRAMIKYLNGISTRLVAFHFLFELLLIDDDETTGNLFTEPRCYFELYELFPEMFAQIILENYVDERDTECHKKIYELFDVNLNFHFQWNRFAWMEIIDLHRKEELYYLIAESRSSFVGVLRNHIQNKYGSLQIDDTNYLQNKINWGKFKMKLFFSEIYNDSGNRNRRENLPLQFYLKNFIIFYHLHKKPMAFYFATIGVTFWENLIKNARINVNRVGQECRLMSRSSTGRIIPKKIPYDNLIKFVAAGKAFENYNEWTNQSKQEVIRENSILQPYNYNGWKMFFHVYMQSKCNNFNKFDYAFIGHSKKFAVEYQCGTGDNMNYNGKCDNRIF
ncbi:hypothetical protein ACFFRR_006736 [Megaselia abdita]